MTNGIEFLAKKWCKPLEYTRKQKNKTKDMWQKLPFQDSSQFGIPLFQNGRRITIFENSKKGDGKMPAYTSVL